MANELLSLNDKEIRQLTKFYKKSPKKFQFVTANILNKMAFDSRTQSLNVINKKMTVRSPGFVKRSVIVNKANGRESISSQVATYGSAERKGFTGWEEQETGKKQRRKRIPTTAARGGSKQKKVRPSARMKPSNEFVDLEDFEGTSRPQKVAHGLRILKKRKWRKAFILKKDVSFSGGGSLKAGLYQFKAGNQLKKLQKFEYSTNKGVKRVRWMSGGTKIALSKINIRELLGEEITKQLEFKKNFKRR